MMHRILDSPARIAAIMREVAEAEILPRFRMLEAHEIGEKKPGDLVTVADHAAEAAFRVRLAETLPGSLVLGEEGYEDDPAMLKKLGLDDPVWIVDPLDGTHNFAHGRHPFTVIVALYEKGRTLAGWIVDPDAGEAVYAVEGGGVAVEPAPGRAEQARRRPLDGLAAARMTAGTKLRGRIERAAARLGAPLPEFVGRYRCVGREYMDIATGTLDLARYAGFLKPWDHAAGCLIAAEGGGRGAEIASDLPYQPAPALSTAPIGVVGDAHLWHDFRDLIRAADGL